MAEAAGRNGEVGPQQQPLDAKTLASIADLKARTGVDIVDDTAVAIVAVENETGIRLTLQDIAAARSELHRRFTKQIEGLSSAASIIEMDLPRHAINAVIAARRAAGTLQSFASPVPRPLINTTMDLELACDSPYAYHDYAPSSPKGDDLAIARTGIARGSMRVVARGAATEALAAE